jgi:putative hydrolase of the HAD superfamily
MFTTVIFDCGEVLIQGMHGVQTTIARLIGCDERHVWKELNADPKNEMFCGSIGERQYWQALIERNQWPTTAEQLAATIRENFTEVPGTRAIIEALRAAGFKIGLLSVHTREWVEYCEERHRYHHLFHVRQYSCDVGMRKPDPRVFRKILEDLGSQPHETIFVDDHPRNVAAAEMLGIRAVRFRCAEQLADDLGRLVGLNFKRAP